ncbi:hypothetical protein ACRAWD_09705 [Caulobacter segnis]
MTESKEGDAYEKFRAAANCGWAALIENMRREGFEVSRSRVRAWCSRPDPRNRQAPGADGRRHDRRRRRVLSGIVIEKVPLRKAELRDMGPSGAGKTRIQLTAPSLSLADRLPGRGIPDRHPRFGRAEPRVQPLRAAYKGAIDQQAQAAC